MKVFRILRLTFHRKSASKCWIREIIIGSPIHIGPVQRQLTILTSNYEYLYRWHSASLRSELRKFRIFEILNFHPCVQLQLARILKFCLNKFKYYTLQGVNNKGADLTVQMDQLVCTFGRLHQCQGFLASRPKWFIVTLYFKFRNFCENFIFVISVKRRKNLWLWHDLSSSVNGSHDVISRGFYFHKTSHMRSFAKIKPSLKFPNLQYNFLQNFF